MGGAHAVHRINLPRLPFSPACVTAHENQNKMKTTKREDIIDNVGQGGKENGKLKGKLKMKRRGLEATSERNPLRNNYSDPSRVLL